MARPYKRNRHEAQIQKQIRRQEVLLTVNRGVQEMTRPADLERVAQVCFAQLRALELPFCALAIQRLVDESANIFSCYEVQPSGDLHCFIADSPNLFRLWRLGQTRYRPDLDADMGGLSPADREAISARCGRTLKSILNVFYPEGILSVLSDQANPFSEGDIRFLEQVAQVLSVGMRRLEDMEHLDAVVQHVPDGIGLLDSAKRLVFANAPGLALFKDLAGAAPGEVVGLIDGRSLEAIQQSSQNMPLEVALPDGRAIEVSARATDGALAHRGWVVVCRDVTYEREIQEKAAHQDRLAAVGQLAAGIAHDFNNMLTVVTGFAQLLELRDDMPETAKAKLLEIHNQGQRAAQLVRQILDFSRVSPVEKQVLNLAPFVKETAKLLVRTLPETIVVHADMDGGDFRVSANLTQLQQVLTNLAVNARDAMPAGGVLAFKLRHIYLEADERPPSPDMPPGSYVQLVVSDTGTGMPPEVLNRIFEPFYTTKNRGESTGLGLPQVYGIVKQHDGFIEVESAEGQGAAFAIFLPRVDGDVTSAFVEAHGGAISVDSRVGEGARFVVQLPVNGKKHAD